MWGDVEKLYWERSVQNDAIKGIVVIFGWVSLQEMHLKNYVDLYSSFGWNSLICYPNFLNAFFPEKATSLAFLVLNELIKELRIRPYPIVFASFSGGPKACLYKVIQLIDGTSAAPFNPDDKQLVQKCICGNIYDSSPTDCRSNLCSLFTHHPWSLKIPYSTKLLSSVAKGVASGLDALFLARFVLQDNEYWHTLCSSINSGAPYLFLFSESDDLAPCEMICKFARCLRDHGGDVELVKWSESPHVGHYMRHPTSYRAAVFSLLKKAASIYSTRIQQLELEGERIPHDEISDLIGNFQKASVSSRQSLGSFDDGPSCQFFMPQPRFAATIQEDAHNGQRERLSNAANTPSISAHSVLGQMLFDVCIPKNIEGWDIKSCSSLNGQPFASTRRCFTFKSTSSLRRSKL